MFETLFGEGQYALKFVIAFVGVLALIGLTVWLIRRFGAERLGTGAVRGRQPRLAVIDAASVDGRRRLVLIRRDNVEHLMMIGGPTDVVVEANIVRAAAPGREPQAPRPPAAADTLPRAVPLGEDNMWPLQPEPAPAPAPAPRVELPPMPRAPQRQPSPPPPMTAEEQPDWGPEPEEPSPPPPPPPQLAPQRRPARAGADPLAGLADEISRGQPPQPEAPSPEPRPVRRESRMPRPQSSMPPVPPSPPPAPPQSAEPQFNSPADQNLAEMAHRLEAALRRPGKPESFAEPPARVAPSFDARADEDEDYDAPPPPPPAGARRGGKAGPQRTATGARRQGRSVQIVALRQPRTGNGEPVGPAERQELTPVELLPVTAPRRPRPGSASQRPTRSRPIRSRRRPMPGGAPAPRSAAAWRS